MLIPSVAHVGANERREGTGRTLTHIKIKAALVMAAAFSSAALSVSPASAAPGWRHTIVPDYSESGGAITFHNRSATVDFFLLDQGHGSTSIKFRPFAGSTELPSVGRTVTEGTEHWNDVGLGGSDIVGGITSVQVITCYNSGTAPTCKHSTVHRP
jgi:hypothetical protein